MPGWVPGAGDLATPPSPSVGPGCSRWPRGAGPCGGCRRRRAGRCRWPCWGCSGGCCRAAVAACSRHPCYACRCSGRIGNCRHRGRWNCWCWTWGRALRWWCGPRRGCCCMTSGLRASAPIPASASCCPRSAHWVPACLTGCCSAMATPTMPVACPASAVPFRRCRCGRRQGRESTAHRPAIAASSGDGMGWISRYCIRCRGTGSAAMRPAACCASLPRAG